MLEVDMEKRIKLHGIAEHPWVTEDGLSPMTVDVCYLRECARPSCTSTDLMPGSRFLER
jgi:hypothetical protein